MLKIGELAELTGVTNRTLRYYEEISLLIPSDYTEAGYRLYGQEEIDALQLILFYRALDFPLEKIKEILDSEDFNILDVLESQKQSLVKEQNRIENLIKTVEKTIAHEKGEITMKNSEKFKEFKETMIAENKEKYGDELEEKYSEKDIKRSEKAIMEMSERDMEHWNQLSDGVNMLLKVAVEAKDCKSKEAKELVEAHQKWIKQSWGYYDIEAHKNLVNSYLEDKRFIQYYDDVIIGGTKFLVDAVNENL